MTRLTVESIGSINDMEPIEVFVRRWGGTVLVRPLTLQQINLCSQRATDDLRKEINPHVRNGWYLVEGLLDPKIDLKTAEVWLTEKNAEPVADILATILTASGLTERAKEAAKSEPDREPAPEVPDAIGGEAGEDPQAAVG